MSATQQRGLVFGALEGLCLDTLWVWGCEVLGFGPAFGAHAWIAWECAGILGEWTLAWKTKWNLNI